MYGLLPSGYAMATWTFLLVGNFFGVESSSGAWMSATASGHGDGAGRIMTVPHGRERLPRGGPDMALLDVAEYSLLVTTTRNDDSPQLFRMK